MRDDGWSLDLPTRLDASLLEGCANQGSEEEVKAHEFLLLEAVRPAQGADPPPL